MTSIDDLKHDVRSIGNKQLSSLAPEERVRAFAKTSVEGDDDQMEWLRETIPASSHADYREKMLVAVGLSRSATYGLHMGYMEYRLANAKLRSDLLASLAMPEMFGEDIDEDSPLAEIDLEPLDHEKIMDHAMEEVETAATWLYIEYHANKRFANEVLDVDLEEFLALSPSGWINDVDFGAVLERAEGEGHITDPTFVDNNDNIEEWLLEDAVEHLYDELVRDWEGDLEEDEA